MGNKSIENKEETEELSLKDLISKISDLFRYILSKWVLVMIFVALGGALGFAYAWFKKPDYTAVTTFVLQENDKASGLGQYAGLASMAGIDLGGGGGGIFQGDNILELYKSRTMIEKTLLTEIEYNGKKELLVDLYISFNGLREKWAKKAELKSIHFNNQNFKSGAFNFTRLQDSVLGVIVNDINKNNLSVVKPDKKLNIIQAEVKAKNEIFAKAFNEQIVKNVSDFYIQTKTSKSIENVAILQQKTDSVRAVMNGAIYTAAAVTDATPNLNITRQVQRIAPVQRSQFSMEINKTILGELVKNLELSKISLRKETPLIQVIDHPVFPLSTNKLGKISTSIMGGFIMGFLTVCVLIINMYLKKITS